MCKARSDSTVIETPFDRCVGLSNSSRVTKSGNSGIYVCALFRSDDPNKSVVPSDGLRRLHMETRKCNNLGISLLGGNAVGIFVHDVQPDSLAYNAGLRYDILLAT